MMPRVAAEEEEPTFVLARAPVRALVRALLRDRSASRKLSKSAMRLLQGGAEAHLARAFSVARAIARTHYQRPEAEEADEADEEKQPTLRMPAFQLAVRLL